MNDNKNIQNKSINNIITNNDDNDNDNNNNLNNDIYYISSSDDEDYIIKTKNLSNNLSKEFNLPEIISFDKNITISNNLPKEHGLHNSDVIIPSYYIYYKNDPSKILNIDFYEIIKNDIRNSKVLNKYQLEYIKYIKDEYKYELIEIYNEIIKLYTEIIK